MDFSVPKLPSWGFQGSAGTRDSRGEPGGCKDAWGLWGPAEGPQPGENPTGLARDLLKVACLGCALAALLKFNY